MAKIQFKSYPQGQTVFFPSDLGENIPENDPVRIVSRIVDGLNIDSLIETYEAFGCPPYHPRMLLKVVFYAYMNNTYSCRRIESAMLRDIYYVCPIGQRMHNIGTVSRKNENGYTSYITNYEAQNCSGCPLRCVCYKGKQGNRVISVTSSEKIQTTREGEAARPGGADAPE